MILSLYFVLEECSTFQTIKLFIALVIFSILFSLILTFVNINLFNLGYWAKRLTTYIFFSSAVIAPIALIKIVDGIKRSQKRSQTSTIYHNNSWNYNGLWGASIFFCYCGILVNSNYQ